MDNDDDAYQIFETLNTRGKDLRLSDLVKSYLTRLIKPENVKVDTAKLTWEKILTTIDGSATDIDIDSFLHHHWLSKYDYLPIKKMFKKLKKTVKKPDASNFLGELKKDSITYREIHETTFRKWTKEEKIIKGALDALSLFRVKQQVPMILSVMRDYKAGLLKRKDVEKILTSIEKFHFMFNIGQMIDYENTTIEHLMPQSSVGINGITEPDVGQLGNLILVPSDFNVKLDKKSFLNKRKILKEKNVFLDSVIEDAQSWDASEINKRTKWLSKIAYEKVWALRRKNLF